MLSAKHGGEMPKWLRRTEIVLAVIAGLSGAMLGYSRGATGLAALVPFLGIEAAWYVYCRKQGIPHA